MGKLGGAALDAGREPLDAPHEPGALRPDRPRLLAARRTPRTPHGGCAGPRAGGRPSWRAGAAKYSPVPSRV